MTIKTGDKIPACTMKTMGEKGPTDITTDEVFAGKKVLSFRRAGGVHARLQYHPPPRIRGECRPRSKPKAWTLSSVCQ